MLQSNIADENAQAKGFTRWGKPYKVVLVL